MRVTDLVGRDGIEEKHLISYTYPTDDELTKTGVTGLFLGHYLPWDGMSNTLISQANGFITYDKIVEGSMVNYRRLPCWLLMSTCRSKNRNLCTSPCERGQGLGR